MARTLAWERVGSQFFRNVDGPTMRWDVRMAHSNVRAALCGGVIAVWDRDDVILHRSATAQTTAKPQLRLFDSLGVEVGRITLDFGAVMNVLVTISETIVVITTSGLIRHYIDFGRNFIQLRLPFDVLNCSLSKGGYMVRSRKPASDKLLELAYVTTANQNTSGEENNEPRYHLLSLEPQEGMASIDAWAFIPEDKSIGRVNQVLVITNSGTAYIYDIELSYLSQRKAAENVASKHVVVSPSGNFVVFSDGTNLKVYATDFHDISYEGRDLPKHHSLKWVGDEALALISRDGEADILALADNDEKYKSKSQIKKNIELQNGASTKTGTNTDTNKEPLSKDRINTIFFEEDEVALISELDCLRILSKYHHSMFAPVSKPTEDTFKLGSIAPSAILYSSLEEIQEGTARSDQTAKMAGPDGLQRAVETCIAASHYEIETKIQKRLLSAASFGKIILDVYDSSEYLDTLLNIRIGNALRNFKLHPLFVTYHELLAMGTATILKRLEYRKLWAEAISIAELYKIPPESIYIEWGCDMIMTSEHLSDDELLDALNAKLTKLGPYSRSKMALRAIEQGRQQLAAVLLENEPVSSDKVRLLLEMGMGQTALEQAVQSGDPYLVDYVLIILSEQLSMPQLMRVIGTNRIATDRQKELVQLRENPTQQLHDFLYHMDLRRESLLIEFDDLHEALNKAATQRDVDQHIQGLRALDKKLSAYTKNSPDARSASELADLLSTQKQLEIDFQTKFVGLSASETISTLLKVPQLSQAQRLRAKLGISERQFWWLRLRALVDRREFQEVWELGQSRKSPIGYQPFFDVCYEAGNYETAAKFVDLINEASLEDKIKMLVKMKNIDAARNLAAKSRDPNLIAMLNGL